MDQKNEMVKLIEFVRQELDALWDQLTAEEKTRRGSLQMWSAKACWRTWPSGTAISTGKWSMRWRARAFRWPGIIPTSSTTACS
jgi:hypothetical protein